MKINLDTLRAFGARGAAFAALLGAAALGSSAFAQDRELGSGGEVLDGVAAVVDNGVVLKSELTDRVGIVVLNMRKQQASYSQPTNCSRDWCSRNE